MASTCGLCICLLSGDVAPFALATGEPTGRQRELTATGVDWRPSAARFLVPFLWNGPCLERVLPQPDEGKAPECTCNSPVTRAALEASTTNLLSSRRRSRDSNGEAAGCTGGVIAVSHIDCTQHVGTHGQGCCCERCSSGAKGGCP